MMSEQEKEVVMLRLEAVVKDMASKIRQQMQLKQECESVAKQFGLAVDWNNERLLPIDHPLANQQSSTNNHQSR